MPVRTYILILQPVPRGVKGLVTCNAEVIAGDADGDQVLDAEELALDGAVGDGLPPAQVGAEDFDAFLALAVGGGCWCGPAGFEALFEAKLHVVVVTEAADEEEGLVRLGRWDMGRGGDMYLWAVAFLLETVDLLSY
jgi:hypothetical protein